MSVRDFVQEGLYLGGLCPRRHFVRDILSRSDFVQKGLCLGIISRGNGLYPVIMSGDMSRGILSGDINVWGIMSVGLCPVNK